MALAIRCDQLIRDSVIANQSELADFGHITTARMTQIKSLLNLAPDIQERILFFPRTEHGRDAIKDTDVRLIAQTLVTCAGDRSHSAFVPVRYRASYSGNGAGPSLGNRLRIASSLCLRPEAILSRGLTSLCWSGSFVRSWKLP